MATYAEHVWEAAGSPRLPLPDEEKLLRLAWEREKEVARAAVRTARMKLSNRVDPEEAGSPEEVLRACLRELEELEAQIGRLPAPV